MTLPESDHERLSAHFTVAELTFSDTAIRHGLDNTPSPTALAALRVLVTTILEPARLACGPIRVNSGYRSGDVNKLVGGSMRSQHMRGEAADIVPLAVTLQELYRWLYVHTPFDQLIWEYSTWIHVSCAPGREPRQVALVSERSPMGVVSYRQARTDEELIPT